LLALPIPGGVIDGPDKQLHADRVAVKGFFAPSSSIVFLSLPARRHLGAVQPANNGRKRSAYFLQISGGESPSYLGAVHFITDTLAELASPVRALIWPPTGRCRDAQLVPVESILSPVVVELHLEGPVLTDALPV
jgi:hypothetical protein